MLATAVFTLLQQSVLYSHIDALLNGAELSGSISSVCVTTKEGRVVYEHNADTRLVPASNEKILTAVYALDTLGPDWHPRTRFWKQGDDMIVEAPGDPTITTAMLMDVKAKLNLPQVKRVFVKQAFMPGYPPAWEYDDLYFTYAAPIHALSFDNAAFKIFSSNGKFAEIPAYLGVKSTWNQNAKSFSARLEPWTATLSLNGPPSKKDQSMGAFPIPDPSAAACRLLGGRREVIDSLPVTAPDTIIEGPALADIMALCLKPSDNTYAEHILLMTAAEKEPLKGDSYSLAEKALTQFLETQVKIPLDSARPIDGSGLSRQNLITSRAMAQVLRYAWSNGYRASFVKALPHPGDGTLKNRLAGFDVAAKTGTISSVTCLSGYLGASTENPLIFSILFNHSTRAASQMRGLQDRIIKELSQNGFASPD